MIQPSKLFFLISILWLVGCSDEDPNIQHRSYSDFKTAEQCGLDADVLKALITEIENGGYGEVHSLLIRKNDKLVIEEYFLGFKPDQQQNIYSVTKSISSALTGIAIDKGYIDNVNHSLLSFFPEYTTIDNWDASKEDITLENVLTMSSGFEWDESTYRYEDSRNINYQMSVSDDMIKFVLDQPMSTTPGEIFRYTSGGSTLLSGIINNTTGVPVEEFADQFLFTPLRITNWEWWKGADGKAITGWGLLLTPRSMIKIGTLFLNNGTFNNQQLISTDWIAQSTATHINVNEWADYAYQWWRYADENTINELWQTNDVFYAHGYGGQWIWVLPHLDMVIVSTGGNYEQTRKSEAMMWDYLLPAVNE